MTATTMDISVKPRRSFIFTPALRPEMYPKALTCGTDIVCVELEDGIAPKDKDEARRNALALFEQPQADDGVERIVLINCVRSLFGMYDGAHRKEHPMDARSRTGDSLPTHGRVARAVHSLLAGLALNAAAYASTQGLESRIMTDEPKYVFIANWSNSRPRVDLEAHDVLLSSAGRAAAVNASLPVSHWIRTGANAMQLYAWPTPFEEDYELSFSMRYASPGDNLNTDARTAFTVSIRPGSEMPEPLVTPGEEDAPLTIRASDVRWEAQGGGEYYKLTIPFQNTHEMPLWCWERGDMIAHDAETLESLTNEYRRLYGLFAAKDNAALLAEMSGMIDDLAKASGEKAEYVRHRVGFGMFFDAPDAFALLPFPDEPLKLNIGAGGKIAWLTQKGINVPIRFAHLEQKGVSTVVSLYFIRRGDEWSICR